MSAPRIIDPPRPLTIEEVDLIATAVALSGEGVDSFLPELLDGDSRWYGHWKLQIKHEVYIRDLMNSLS